MIIVDSIYGEFKIEPVLEELIHTPAVQRLKRIHLGNASYLINPHWNVTRYEHSIGVMLLIRKLGGSIEEQIAGLLHDVSKTAFSHVVDFSLNNLIIHNDVIRYSQIPKILESYGYNVEILYDKSKFTIVDKPLPYLCADRVDSILRDIYRYGYVEKVDILTFLNELTIVSGEVVVTSLKSAEWLVKTYYKEVVDFFYDSRNIHAHDCLSKALVKSVELGEITSNILMQDEAMVLYLLKKSTSSEVRSLIESVSQGLIFKVDEKAYDLSFKVKSQLIDPTVLIEGNLYQTSELSCEIKYAT